MSEIVRFGVSMDKELVDLLDDLKETEGHPNRSETLRALVRQELINSSTRADQKKVTAVITLMYHYTTALARVPLQEYPSLRLLTNLQQHIDREICIKVLIVTGEHREVDAWAKALITQRNVIGKLTISATEDLYQELRK